MRVNIKEMKYTSLVLFHVFLGILMYLNSKTSVPYGLAILSIGLLVILQTQNKENQVLYIAGYTIGSEVMLRMTGGFLFYEVGKYSIVTFMIMSMYLSGFSKNATPIWVYLLFLIPGVIVATYTLNLDTNIKKSISFNLSGPLCLGISALYCYQRKVTLEEIENILLSILLPIITIVTYLYFYTPNIRDVVTSTQSNFETSGGFGPNQVATIIGLGMFILFSRLMFHSKERLVIILNLFLLGFFTFRGIVTFSRGGMFCAVTMVFVFLVVLFRKLKRSAKIKILWALIFALAGIMLVWRYSSDQTSGLIEKRYANQDAQGRVKASVLTGREEIIETEIKLFLENPIWGAGIGKGKEDRIDKFGEIVASHNEITRMLAEQGSFGVAILLILILTPLFLYINNRRHIYFFPFLVFWILTINHAAMRLAAPAFVYALSLLHVYGIEKPKNANQVILKDQKI